MSDFVFDDFALATLGGAKNAADGSPLTANQIQQVVDYLNSQGSGPDERSSYADYLAGRLRNHQARLADDMGYIAYSGVDSDQVSNSRNAERYVQDLPGKAGTIGNTPWGKFIKTVANDPEFVAVERKFSAFMRDHAYQPFSANDFAGALQDIMWNAGSPEYLRNAVESGRPIVAFVENAPRNRGFSNFELPVALKHPDVVMNGYPTRAFGAGDDALAFASRSAAEYQALERSIAEAATRNSGREVSVADVRSNLDIAGGYIAIDRTVFGMPRESFEQFHFDEMRSVGLGWSQSGANVRAARIESSAEVVAKAPVVESHLPTGPPQGMAEVPPRSLADKVIDIAHDKMVGAMTGKKPLQMGFDGLPNDDVPHVSATPEQLQQYQQAAEQLYQHKTPQLWDSKDPHSHLIIAGLDGTQNDVAKDRLHATNIARLQDEVLTLNSAGIDRIHVEYKAGPGTQSGWLEGGVDSALGRTTLERADQAYWQIVERANKIYDLDPNAKISYHVEGFSRGGSEVPMLARMLDERGIPDLKSVAESVDEHGNVTRAYAKHHQFPGAAPISLGLYDPVPTGYQQWFFDRRPPSSVVSGFQLVAEGEQRGLFPVDEIFPEGFSEDGRFLRVSVPGKHSDIGGSYLRDGLAVRNYNLMTDYRNSLLSEPLFLRLHETNDPKLTVLHDSTQTPLFRIAPKADRATPEGRVEQLTPDYAKATPLGQVVHVPNQAPEPVDTALLRKLGPVRAVERSPQAPEPVRPAADELLLRVMNDESVVLKPYRAPLTPEAKGIGALGAIGAAAGFYDAKQSGERIATLLSQDNANAAGEELTRFVARNGAGWGGGVLAASMVGTSGTGPLALVVTDAYMFSAAADKAVTIWQNEKIYSQTDAGVAWKFNGKQWLRDDLRADLVDDGQNQMQKQAFAAPPDVARRLSYRAGVEAVEQAIGNVPEPRNPLVQAANDADPVHLKVKDWTYNPESDRWSRSVADSLDRNDLPVWKSEPEYASPERAAQLGMQAVQVIDGNLIAGPAAIAARYEIGYKTHGYGHLGEVPMVVTTALLPDRLQASDGNYYHRDVQGVWTHEGEAASPSRALELELTHYRLMSGLEQHRTELANKVREWQPLTPQENDREALRQQYIGHGWNPDHNPEQFEARYLAAQRTRQAWGLTMEDTALVLQTDAAGRADLSSPILHTRMGPNKEVLIVATTDQDEVAVALADVQARARAKDTDVPEGLEQRIVQASPQEQDAREQAMREANRQGLSQDETQQAARLATIAVGAKRAGLSSSRGTQSELVEESEATSQIAEATPSQPTPPAPMPVRDIEEREPEAESKDVPLQPVAQVSQNEAKSAPSPEDRTQDAPDAPAVAHTYPLAEPSPQPTDARRHVPEPPAGSDTEMSVSQQPAIPAEQPIAAVMQKTGISDDDAALPVHRDSAVEMADRPFPTPRSQERADEAKVVTAAPDQPPPLQEIKAPLVRSAEVPHNARAEQEGRSELAMAPARTFIGDAGHAPGDAAESREKDRDDVDRREATRAEAQSISSDAPLPPVTVRADAREQDDEQKRIDHGRRAQESPDSLRTSEQATPETAPRSFDPRHPDHPDHAMYQNAREKVADLYERHGIPTQEDQLERTTAALLSDARANKMTRIEEVQFTVSRQKPDGEITVAGNLLAWEGDPKQQSQMPWMKFSATDVQTIDQRDPDRDYARFREETIKEQKSLEAFQEQQQEINKNKDGPVMRIGPRSLDSDANDSSSSDGGGGDG